MMHRQIYELEYINMQLQQYYYFTRLVFFL